LIHRPRVFQKAPVGLSANGVTTIRSASENPLRKKRAGHAQRFNVPMTVNGCVLIAASY